MTDSKLKKLEAAFLRRSWTAEEIAKQFHCSKMTPYTWLREMRKAGFKFSTWTERRGARGPKSRVYGLKERPVV